MLGRSGVFIAPPIRANCLWHMRGGYPSGIYANDEASLDAAKANGFKLIELDFAQEGDTLVLQHDLSKPVAMSLDDLIRWLDRNPGPKIITDIKSDNLAGLAILKAAAGDHLERFIPQIYSLDEYTPVIAMGFQAPIFTVYRIRPGEEPVAEANKLPLRAVTMPAERYQLADRVTHPVYLHTFVNRRSIGTPYRRAKGTPLALHRSIDVGRGFRAAGGVGRA